MKTASKREARWAAISSITRQSKYTRYLRILQLNLTLQCPDVPRRLQAFEVELEGREESRIESLPVHGRMSIKRVGGAIGGSVTTQSSRHVGAVSGERRSVSRQRANAIAPVLSIGCNMTEAVCKGRQISGDSTNFQRRSRVMSARF